MSDLVERLRDPNKYYSLETGGDVDLGYYCRWMRELAGKAADALEAKDAEIERLRTGINGIVNCQGGLTRAQVRESCAEILNNRTVGLDNQSPFAAALAEYKSRAEQAERALAEAVEVLRPLCSDDMRDIDDCIDNTGKSYQSQSLADNLAAARNFVKEHGNA